MNKDELKEYILKHMTAEQALDKLLEGHIIEYQKLKFSEEGKEIHPTMLIAMAALEMGWDIVISNAENPDAYLEGIIVGTNDYLNSVLNPTDEPESNEHNCSCGDCSCGH